MVSQKVKIIQSYRTALTSGRKFMQRGNEI